MSNLVILGLFFVCIVLFLLFGCPVMHYMGQKCQQRLHRRKREELERETAAATEQFFMNTCRKNRSKSTLDGGWLNNNSQSDFSLVSSRSQSRGRRGNIRMKLPITPEQLSQILRPAALATFLNSIQSTSKNPPPEILSQQSVDFSPLIVQTLFTRVRGKSRIPQSLEPSNPSTQKQNKQKRRSSPGIKITNDGAHVTIDVQSSSQIASGRSPERASSNGANNSPVAMVDSSAGIKKKSREGSSCFIVSPSTDSIIISSSNQVDRKAMYSKKSFSNHQNSQCSHITKRIPSIQVVQGSNHQRCNSYADAEVSCVQKSLQNPRVKVLANRRTDAKPFSFHDSLPALNEAASNKNQRNSSLYDTDSSSQSFCVTEV